MIDVPLIILAFFALIVSSYTDMRTREVPDLISYGLIICALVFRIILSIIEWDPSIIVNGIIGFLAFVLVGYTMYYTGQWGGGDSKLLMGLGAVIGLPLHFSIIPEILIYFILVLFVGGIYGIVYISALALINRKKVKKEAQKKLKDARKNTRILFIITILLLLITGVFVKKGAIIFFILSFFPILIYYSFIIVKAVEKVALHKVINPKKLVEGDWLVDDIVVNKKVIASKKDLGLTKKQIATLQKLYAQKKIKGVKVKDGIPFVPSFLFAYIMFLLFSKVLTTLL